MRSKSLFGLLALVTVGLLLVGCAKSAAPAATPSGPEPSSATPTSAPSSPADAGADPGAIGASVEDVGSELQDDYGLAELDGVADDLKSIENLDW